MTRPVCARRVLGYDQWNRNVRRPVDDNEPNAPNQHAVRMIRSAVRLTFASLAFVVIWTVNGSGPECATALALLMVIVINAEWK